MINSQKPEKYVKSHKIVIYDEMKEGKCQSRVISPEIADEFGDSYHEARNEVWKKELAELKERKLSPIKMYFDFYNMNIKDLAIRMNMPIFKVKKHLFMEGFKKLTVNELQKYAKIFDVPIGDFFNFYFFDESIIITHSSFDERIFQELSIVKRN